MSCGLQRAWASAKAGSNKSGVPTYRIKSRHESSIHNFDLGALTEAWQKIPAADKRDSKVAAAAAQCFMALGAHGTAQDVIEQSLAENWDSALALLYAEPKSGDVLRRIERAEGWLQAHPRDAALLLALGRLCIRQGLWGKAQSYLEASLAIDPGYAAHLALARLHESLGNTDAAHRHYRQTLELAVAQLTHDAARERRPAPL